MAKRKKQKKIFNNEIIGIIFISLSLLTLLGVIFKDLLGIFGEIVHNVFIGTLGIGGYILPAVIFLVGLTYMAKKNNNRIKKILYYFIMLTIFIPAFIHSLGTSTDVNILKYYDLAHNSIFTCGGFIPGIICYPLLLLLKKVGTAIVFITLIIITIILITGVSVVSMLSDSKKRLENRIKANTSNNRKKEAPDIILNEDNKKDNKKIKKQSKYDIKIEDEEKEEPVKKEKRKEEEISEPEITFSDNTLPQSTEKSKQSKKQDNQQDIEIKIEKEDHKYVFPPISFLNDNVSYSGSSDSKNAALEDATKLETVLKDFGISAKVINISRGPAITRYELKPSSGVKVSKIVNLSDDIALALASSGIRIEAPIPGKSAIGIEVPNKKTVSVYLKEIINSDEFRNAKSNVSFAVGKDISGANVVGDIASMPHLLVAGATGSGKSVCINSLIISLLYKASPNDVKLIMIDPKVVELGNYNGIPHLLIPVVTDPKKAAFALNWAVQEMTKRYNLFAANSVRDISGYNALCEGNSELEFMPHIVIIVDELADLMMVAPKDVENSICRLAQMARAAGMHLVIATQRPSVDVITGTIKANIPSRIAFSVSSQVDSRTILDMAGAEKLLGKGDMLYYPIGIPKPIRVKGTFVSDKEVERVVNFVKRYDAEYDEEITNTINNQINESNSSNSGGNDAEKGDVLLDKAIDIVIEYNQASTSFIQRKLSIGYSRAGRIIDQLEERGIIGPQNGSKPREILISKIEYQEMKMQKDSNDTDTEDFSN